MTTYNIGPGQTHETFAAFHSAVNPVGGDIVDGGANTFRETVIPEGGSNGNPVIYQNAVIKGSDDYSGGATYQWTTTGAGTNEWFLELSGGGDPGINEPQALYLDGVRLAIGTAGSLADHEWDWAASPGTLVFHTDAETGDTSDFDSIVADSGNSFTASATAAINGANGYLLDFGGTNDNCYGVKDFTAQSDIYVRAYFQGSAFALPSNFNFLRLFEFYASGQETLGLGIVRDDGLTNGWKLNLAFLDNSGWNSGHEAGDFDINAAHYMEVRYRVHASDGGAQVWLDGALIIDQLGNATDTRGPIDRIFAGINAQAAASPPTGDMYMDDLIVSDAPIGAFSAGEGAGFMTVILRDDSGDPDTTGAAVEGSQRQYGITDGGVTGKGHLTFDAITVQHAYNHGVRLWNAVGGIAFQNGCDVSWNEQAGVSIRQDGTANVCDGVTFDPTFTATWNGYQGVGIGNATINVTFRGETHHNAQDPGPFDQAGFRVAGSRTNYGILVDGAYCHHEGKDAAGSDISGMGVGIWLDTVDDNSGADPAIVRDCITTDCANAGIFCENTKNSRWYNNRSLRNGEEGIRLGCSSGSVGEETDSNVIILNTCYENRRNIRAHGTFSVNSHDTIKNNIVKYNACDGATDFEFGAINGAENADTAGEGRGSGNVYEENCFGAEFTNMFNWGLNNFLSTYDALETAYGGAMNNVERPPQLLDPDNNNTRLLLSSPCRDRGGLQGLSITADAFGITRPLGQAPDMGAAEVYPAQAAGATGLGI